MKILGRYIDKDKSGYIRLSPEEPEDLWHLYNLIAPGDQVKTSTFRRVQLESSTGTVDSKRINLTLTLQVDATEFDAEAPTVIIKGRNTVENEYVKLGQYHTFHLELKKTFTLIKSDWDVISLDRINVASDVSKRAEMGAIVLQEGLANVCLLTEFMTLVRQRVEVGLPTKRKGSSSSYEKATKLFFDQLAQAFFRHIDLNIVKVVLIASPGFIKDKFYEYLCHQAIQANNRTFIENKSKIIVLHCSSGHKQALLELIQDPTVVAKLHHTKFAEEMLMLDKFYQLLHNHPHRAIYGMNQVVKAAELQAIQVLLMSDQWFRHKVVETRKKAIQLTKKVKADRGQVLIYSSMHVTGEQLNQLTGIAAILSYAIPELDEDEP
ncbi:hypothetical protein HMI56_004400 [Coelomomyces lativittatus]|nr:hypothetical protein HMI56_004400 [Coelomomyces lativittatus]